MEQKDIGGKSPQISRNQVGKLACRYVQSTAATVGCHYTFPRFLLTLETD